MNSQTNTGKKSKFKKAKPQRVKERDKMMELEGLKRTQELAAMEMLKQQTLRDKFEKMAGDAAMEYHRLYGEWRVARIAYLEARHGTALVRLAKALEKVTHAHPSLSDLIQTPTWTHEDPSR